MSIEFKLHGVASMRRFLDEAATGFPDHVASALRVEAEEIMTTSKRDFVPVDFGALRATGHVERPVRSGKDISVTMIYGGDEAPYAIPVHEHPSKYSPPSWVAAGVVTFSPAGHGPKYLERPMNDAAPGMAERLAQRIGVGP